MSMDTILVGTPISIGLGDVEAEIRGGIPVTAERYLQCGRLSSML